MARQRKKPSSADRQERRRKSRAAFSVALSVFSLPMSVAALLFPLPVGLAAVISALTSLVAARRQKWPAIIALIAVFLAVGGLVGGFLIGLAVTDPK